jgi:hypothetical protein
VGTGFSGTANDNIHGSIPISTIRSGQDNTRALQVVKVKLY